jgi:hypothetical protein
VSTGNVWLRKIKSFVAIPFSVKKMFLEAYFTTIYVKITLFFLPFRKVAQWLGKPINNPEDEVSVKGIEIAKNVKFALQLCERYSPFHLECYTLSVAGKLLLNRRSQKGILYIGFCKADNGKLKGHAWLLWSGVIVTGGGNHLEYQVHSAFV